MSLLSIVQDTLREIGGFEIPTSVVGNSNETAILSLALVNRSLKETAKRTEWAGITVRGTLTTVASQEEYSLPSDFQSLINATMWDDTNDKALRGPVSAKDRETFQNSGTAASEVTYFRIFKSTTDNNRAFYLFPIPAAIVTIRYEYKSNGLTETSGNVLQSDKFLADTDTAVLDEDVIGLGFKWRILKSRGLPYAEEFRDYEIAIEDAVQTEGAPVIDLGHGEIQRFGLLVPDGNWNL